jgi:hypothetical protein
MEKVIAMIGNEIKNINKELNELYLIANYMENSGLPRIAYRIENSCDSIKKSQTQIIEQFTKFIENGNSALTQLFK